MDKLFEYMSVSGIAGLGRFLEDLPDGAKELTKTMKKNAEAQILSSLVQIAVLECDQGAIKSYKDRLLKLLGEKED